MEFLNVHNFCFFSTVVNGKCAWIGAANLNSGGQYRWIELPPDLNQEEANAELLSSTYSNFAGKS